MRFATYLHPQTFSTSKLIPEIYFTGYSFTYYNQVRHTLKNYLKNYPALPLRKARISDYLRVHSREYLQKIILQAFDRPLDEISSSLPQLSIECQGLEYCLPGYLYGLGGMMEAIESNKKTSIEN